jgi:hypothetical protein
MSSPAHKMRSMALATLYNDNIALAELPAFTYPHQALFFVKMPFPTWQFRSRDRSMVVSLGIFSVVPSEKNHVPWGQLSFWKWVPGISPWVKAAGAFGWRPTIFVVLKVEKIRGLNLPGTPRATSACRGVPLLYITWQFRSTNMGVYQPQPTNWKCSVFVTKRASVETVVYRVNVLDTKISLLARNCICVMSLCPEDKNNLRHHCILQNKVPS